MKICVYGAASNEIDRSFLYAGEMLGREMGKRNHTLVFGGGASGLMGAAARGIKEENGYIIGIAPSFFNVDGILYENCDEFHYTDTMRERKKMMEEESDAFIVTPGGIGTFEEFLEILTLKSLDRHNKPIAILNTNGYYDNLLKFLEDGVKLNFLKQGNLDLYFVSDNVCEILDHIENYSDNSSHIDKTRFK
ncbi:MAG: TIGR00730 family Rossman fold protein [Eubacteriales bacterium]|nr:TIGR00730 family Rossman fold protein [Eubacteriales bacterium]